MTKNLLVALISILTFSNSILAQQSSGDEVTVTGTVVDKSANIPLEYATISFQSINDATKLTGGVTDANGKYSIQVPVGTYKITIEYISFEPYIISEKSITESTSLGTVSLDFASDSLDEVVIRAETTQVDIRLDKKIYNVGKDLLVRGGSVSDVLDNVPSVSVDVEGNVA